MWENLTCSSFLKKMNVPRIKLEGRAFYHCISRVVDRRIVFHADEKEVFRSILRKLETFTGVRVVTYCLMGNHFHLLLEVPERGSLPALDATRLFEILPLLYDKATVETIAAELDMARKAGDLTHEKNLLERYEHRRGDLSVFLKELKQRVSIFINRRLGRAGTLWEGRFKSVLVEGGEAALETVAAYIDLNPVRAGLVVRPEEYRWSGYGEAMGAGRGARKAREGLGAIGREALENPGISAPWETIQERYRRLLYLEGVEIHGDELTGEGARRGIAREEVDRVVEGRAPMSKPEILRRKVRYFTDGAVLGSTAFLEQVFQRLRAQNRIGRKRHSGARRMRGADWGELRVLRDLRERVFDRSE